MYDKERIMKSVQGSRREKKLGMYKNLELYVISQHTFLRYVARDSIEILPSLLQLELDRLPLRCFAFVPNFYPFSERRIQVSPQ